MRDRLLSCQIEKCYKKLMKIKILGTRGEIDDSAPYHSKHSGLLIDGELMLDLGEKEFLKYKPKWILLTHFHPDHAYFIRKKREEKLPPHLNIYAPEKYRGIKVHVLKKRIRLGKYTIIPIPTHHSKLVKSQAYLIKKGKESFLYTGDMVWINKEYHRLFHRVDLIITEASFFKKGGIIRKDKQTGQLVGHNGVPNFIDIFHKSTKKIVFVHFGSWFYQDMAKAKTSLIRLAKEKGLQAVVGYDGLEINISK